MEKSTVSIVEDNKVIRDNVSKFISFHEKFEVVAVHGSATSFLDSLLIDASFTTDILVLDIGLPGISGLEAIPMILAEKRQAIYLIFKEAITNIIRHSNGNHVRIRLSQEKHQLHLQVQDNGIVQNGYCASDGSGLNNMKMRAEKIGGELMVNIEQGYMVELTVS